MKSTTKVTVLFFILLSGCSINMFSQAEDEPADKPQPKKSKFLTGLYVGSYFANKYSASTYNGYGFDVDGNRNSFANSFMYQKIKIENGGFGYAGQHDFVADALGVDQGRWEFNESDMPINMHYMPAILVGFNFKLPVNKSSAFILNINGTKLNLEGNFTITTLNPAGTNPAFNNNIKTCTITGKEQRLLIQLGYQKILGEDNFNFFFEAGFIGTLAKFDQNKVYINTLEIDLTSYINQTLYTTTGPTRKPIGFGIGAFAGIGLNIDINPKFTIQLLYTPSQEKINIGTNPALKLQNGIGFRVYYNLR